ncbi:alpha/beta fold hydrolase [Streptomyces ureilyticus]|uniref:Alpha/beta fold hydrolase n=1 Tax=Streptomyces ureilyticus TaxID=1775131 RepID=A0ABX0DMY8_9ACTN|nr:alpha/beta fold hydrolase [Streptomyces ureilyticus]NGO43243.1 alpha/beta fold hydrolase [Streptomyces ureilyticus]
MHVYPAAGDRSGGADRELDRVFRRVEGITSVGAFIGALEQLTTASTLADDEIFGWPVLRLNGPDLTTGLGKYVAKALEYPHVVALIQTKALAAAGLVLPGASRAQRGALTGTMCGTGMATQMRLGYGLDGSDHFAFINYAGSLLEKLFPHDRRAREAAAAFIAAHSCFSYFTAGVSKLVSPAWRDGSAIPQIFRTGTYGDPDLYEFVRDRPWACKALAWTTIVGETAFPLALVAPKPVSRGILGMGLSFHVANARFMGLNRFVWSFAGTYPAVDHASSRIGPAVRGKALSAVRAVTTRPGRATAALGVAAAAVGVGAGAAKFLGERRRTRLAQSAPGEFVSAGGGRAHVLARTRGGGPSVIFESALACPATEWSWVLDQLPSDTPYLAYDRPGNGWSAPAAGLDAERSVARLKQLIDTLGLKPPYILVGHSFGGLLIRSFALRHPSSIGGLVFVDSTHPDQIERSSRQRENVPWTRQRLARRRLTSLTRPVLRRTHDVGAVTELPGPMAEATAHCMQFPEPWAAARQEFGQWTRSWAPDARRLTDLSPLPVSVLTAAHTVTADPVHGLLQSELAGLSKVSRHETVDDADHDGLVMRREHAARVAAHIDWVSTTLTAA